MGLAACQVGTSFGPQAADDVGEATSPTSIHVLPNTLEDTNATVSPDPNVTDSSDSNSVDKTNKVANIDQIKKMLASSSLSRLLATDDSNVLIAAADVAQVAAVVWQKYISEQSDDPKRMQEDKNNVITLGGLTMRYTMQAVGTTPSGGHALFIALHGGGEAAASLNDSQWKAMQSYYLPCVNEGIYVAPRGITNTYDLHSRPESFIMYDRMIENMILYHNVDPDRVYVLGYSAGGDGVYQIAASIADRFSAVNMSAGHPNGIDMSNVAQLAMLLQVGELDSAYNRHHVTVEYGNKLTALQGIGRAPYIHDTFVHLNKPHNFIDNSPKEALQNVMASPHRWLAANDRTSKSINTSAVSWIKTRTREPLPKTVVWNLSTSADRSGGELWLSPARGRLFYWLDRADHEVKDGDSAEVSIDRSTNTINVKAAPSGMLALAHHSMLDISKPVNVCRNGTCLTKLVRPRLRNIIQSAFDRGDPRLLFAASVSLDI